MAEAMVQYAVAWLTVHGVLSAEEEGQGLVEYALIIVLISIAAIATMKLLAGSITGVFSSIKGSLDAGVAGS
jgi:pilus assembly protein Flp/PilA